MKLVNLIPGKELKSEAIEDMDTNLPAQMQKFLDRTINIIKSYNLSRKKEQLVIAKIIDSLGMDKQQLMQAISKIKKNFPNNPIICFPKGINKNINNFIKEVKPHGISIDYDINLKKLNLNNDVVFQGGMNPKFLLGNNKRMFNEAKKYLNFFKNKPYIFNLGHGILPKTKPENVKRLVEFVRSYNL